MNINEGLNKDNTFNVYCNSIEVSMGRYDFSFSLNQESSKWSRYLGDVTMSPEHAKVFANILMANIQNFEEIFGEIPELDEQKMKKLQQEGKIVFEGNKNE